MDDQSIAASFQTSASLLGLPHYTLMRSISDFQVYLPCRCWGG